MWIRISGWHGYLRMLLPLRNRIGPLSGYPGYWTNSCPTRWKAPTMPMVGVMFVAFFLRNSSTGQVCFAKVERIGLLEDVVDSGCIWRNIWQRSMAQI